MAGLRRYFKPVAALPTATETGIGEIATTAGSIKSCAASGGLGRKRKAYTTFTDEQGAKIGKYTAENGNSAVLKQFTVRLFKRKYIEALKAA